MQECNVQEATHVKIKGGGIEKIVSKWGLDSEGRPAKPSEGGFGVVTESGRRIDMWNASLYYTDKQPTPTTITPYSRTGENSDWDDGIGRP